MGSLKIKEKQIAICIIIVLCPSGERSLPSKPDVAIFLRHHLLTLLKSEVEKRRRAHFNNKGRLIKGCLIWTKMES